MRCQSVNSHPGQTSPASPEQKASSTADASSPSPSIVKDALNSTVSQITSTPGVPPEQSVRAALDDCEKLADWLANEASQPHIVHTPGELDSTASGLLSIDHSARNESLKASKPAPKRNPGSPQAIDQFAKLRESLNNISYQISDAVYQILAHPSVVITTDLLDQYVRIHAKLERPESLPKIFNLYASKPSPREGSEPLTYTKQNPDRAAGAIESKTADAALDAAIAAKNLDAAVGVVENSYGTTAFVRSKLLRHGLLPIGAFVGTPVAAYILATNFSGLQQTMDSATATNVAFAGILAYVGFTASLGVVAATTANDQMKRVSWAPGMALRKRWVREEERAALDKIACAWGFQEPWRQGEEEGPEWDALREYIGQKGMVLDRTELMEGMD
ncbi:hypothetical protein NPX13_g8975 [Xylaria arbuscula]|uniref:Uncharacterized protein n=1 Tax=Xylaria arbuscula TaxID=114810 RepID=A0A9W8THX4_9PEZI|nr:hypothetical protein NPX13_g8975 [Xylaria arbuscula]